MKSKNAVQLPPSITRANVVPVASTSSVAPIARRSQGANSATCFQARCADERNRIGKDPGYLPRDDARQIPGSGKDRHPPLSSSPYTSNKSASTCVCTPTRSTTSWSTPPTRAWTTTPSALLTTCTTWS